MSLNQRLRTETGCPRRRQLIICGLRGLLILLLSLSAIHPASAYAAASKGAGNRLVPRTDAERAKDTRGKSEKAGSAKKKNQSKAVAAVLSRLGLGRGSVVADIGSGKGRYTWVFAKAVGKTGTVFAEDIADEQVKSLEKEAQKRGLRQVRAVLGRVDDPCLPENSADLAFLHHVYHHITKPREMLRGIWRALKPGGYLVVVDRRRGTLRDWVPRERRGKKHFWLAETTVVREAREEGFAFVGCAEECWREHEKEPFVLIFQRPKTLKRPGRDPDPFLHLPLPDAARLFLPLAGSYERPVFIALGEARKLMEPILEHSSGGGLEIVLEEWATQKQERQPLPPGVSLPSTLTDKGDPRLEADSIDVVFFLDSYHLLFHGKVLLEKIRQRLAPHGCIYVLDRRADRPLSRREASHRRMIQVETVEREMAEAGLFLWFRGPAVSADRFVLVFGKVRPGKIPPEADPFFAGPEISQTPGAWLKANYWRLRGLKTADGRYLAFATRKPEGPIEILPLATSAERSWRIPAEKVLLSFDAKGKTYLLSDYQSSDGR